jgi:DNA-binding beta-propeller fold protein YncE
VARTLPSGTPSPDWRRLYRLTGGALDVIDPTTGRVADTHPAPSWADAVRTSANGAWLVFARSGPWDRFQVQDSAWASPPVDVALAGSFTFDGLSDDGQRLYLLEQFGGGHYHVRMYDLRAGALASYVIVDKTDVSANMSGTAVASFATRSGATQLTLYQRPAGQGSAFVHALPIGQAVPWAVCVDLPGPSTGWAFAAAPDGRYFYALNSGSGQVVALDGQNIGRPDLRQAGIAPALGEAVLAVSPDGATLFAGSGSGVLAIDTGTLKVRAKGLAGKAVTALAAAPDGRRLFAVSGSRLLRLDARSLAPAGVEAVPPAV